MSVLALILVVVFMIINLVIYHKIFTVTYFNLGKGCIQELFFAWFVAMLEMGFVVTIGKNIFSVLFRILGFVGKLLLILIVIALVGFIVWKLVQFIKEKAEGDEVKENTANFAQSNESMNRKEEQNHMEMDNNSDTEEKETKADIEITEANLERHKGINNVRETAEFGLKKAKEFVDSVPQIVKESISKEKIEEIKGKTKSKAIEDDLELTQRVINSPNVQDRNTVTCSGCGKVINEEATFCMFCGKKNDIKVDKAICSKCGKKLAVGSNFCHYCGANAKG